VIYSHGDSDDGKDYLLYPFDYESARAAFMAFFIPFWILLFGVYLIFADFARDDIQDLLLYLHSLLWSIQYNHSCGIQYQDRLYAEREARHTRRLFLICQDACKFYNTRLL